MQRLILGAILSCGLLVLAAGPASACLWDRELVPHEKEFKSNYLEQPYKEYKSNSSEQPYGAPSSGPIARGPGTRVGLLAGGAGLLMLLSGLTVGIVRGKVRQRAPSPKHPPAENRP
jgi:hypothetical protein